MDRAINLNRPRGWFAEPPPAISSKVSTVARSRLSCEELVPGDFGCFEQDAFRGTATSGFSLIPHARYLRLS